MQSYPDTDRTSGVPIYRINSHSISLPLPSASNTDLASLHREAVLHDAAHADAHAHAHARTRVTTDSSLDALPENKARSGTILQRLAHGVEGLVVFPELQVSESASLNVFELTHPVRRAAIALARLPSYKWTLLLLIVLDCIMQAFEDPTVALSPFFYYSRVIFTACYVFELLVAVVVMGLWQPPSAYLRSLWHVIDLAVVLGSILSLSGVHHVRFLVVLRPIRILSLSRGLRSLSLLSVAAGALLFNSLMLFIMMTFLFALFGLQVFQGLLHRRCVDVATGELEGRLTEDGQHIDVVCGGDYHCQSTSVCVGGFENPNHGVTGFDNLGQSLLTIFQALTLEGWTQIMYMTQDAGHWAAGLFFIVIVLFGSFFVVNLALAIVKAHFSNYGMLADARKAAHRLFMRVRRGSTIMSEKAQLLSSRAPITREGLLGVRDRVVRASVQLATHRYFQRTFLTLIILNILVMAMAYHGMPEAMERTLFSLNVAFTLAFALEMIVMHVGLGLSRYWNDRMNAFDGIVVIVSLLELAISSSGALGALRAVRAVRVLRMLRVLRVGKLVRHVYTLQRIAWIIKSSIDEIGYVALLLFLAMFFFTLLGKHLFAHQFDFPAEPKPRANFDDFTHSFLTVFQLLTAEEWDTVMYNAIRGRSWWASLFFIVWILLGVYFLLNMFFAIVLQNFERDYAERIERKRIKLQRKRLRKRRRPSRLVYSGLNKSLSRQTSAPGSGTPGSGESPAYVGRGILLPPAASPQLSPGPTPPGRRPLTKSSSFTNLKRSKSDPTKEAASAMVPASADASPSISARRQRARSQQLLAEREQRQLQLLNAAGGGTSHSASNSDLLLTPGASPGLSPADSPQFGRSRENSRDRSYSGLGAYNLVGLDDDLLANDDPATAFSWWRLLCGCRRAPRSSDEAEELASYDRKLRRQSLEIRPLDVVDTGPVAGSDAATDLVNTAKFELHKQSMRGQAPAPVPHPNPPPLDLPPHAPRLQIDLDSSPTSSTSSSVTSSHSTDQLAVSIPSSASYVGGSDDPRRQSLLSLPALAELDETLASPAITPTHSQASAVSPPSPLSLRKQPRKHSLSSDDVLSIPQSESLTLPNVKMTRSLSVDPQPQDQAEVRRQTVLKRAQMQRSQSFSTVQAFDGDVHRYSDAVQAAQEAARRHQEAVAAGHLIQHTDGTYSLGAFKLHRLHIMDHVFAEELWYAKLTHVVHHRLFHGFIFLCIVASTIALAFESPDDEDGGREHDVFFIIDVLFTAIFGVEMVLKMLVLGVAGRQNAYFASNWNRLDAFIVACGVISLSLSGVDVSVLRGLRFLRLMRPLRVISRSEGMRTVINALLLTLPIMANVLFVLFLVYLVFGILAMELFSGRFFSCNVDVSLDKAACRAAGGDWVNARRNFDNIFHSLLTLFEVATLEGYLEIMYNAVDSTSHDAAPVRDHNLGNAFFFVFFIFVASFFLHGLFVGVVFDTFVKLRDDYTGFGFLTPLQKLWVELQMTVLGITPVTIALPPEHPLRRWCHRVISHDYFDPFIYATIGVNTICMALSHDDEPPALQLFINYSNLVFTGVFLVEAALKLIGMGVGVYFADGWNRFDFVVLIGSLIESALFLAASSAKVNFNLIRILRVFRVTRLLHLVAAWDGLYRLLRTLFISLPSLRNVGTLLALMYFVYAVLGVKAFGLVESGECLDRNANFSTFPRAVLTLFRISTGEEWECIMHDCMDESRGGSKFAWVYFVSFVAIVSFIVLNLFIAIILDNFSSVMRREATGSELAQRAKLLDPRVVDGFVTAWARLDPNATKYIPSKKLEALLRRIPPPLGLGMDAGWRDVLEYVRDLHIPVHPGDRIHFTEVLFALVEGRAGMALPESQLQRDIGKRMKQNLPSLKVQMKPYMTFAVYMVVVRAQRAWRRNRQARIEKRREERRAAGLPSDDEDERKEPEVEADPSAAEQDPDSPVQVEIELAEITVSPIESDDAEETSPRQQASAEPERGRPTTPPPAVDED